MTAEITDPVVRMLAPVKQLLVVEGDGAFFKGDMIGAPNSFLRGNYEFPSWKP